MYVYPQNIQKNNSTKIKTSLNTAALAFDSIKNIGVRGEVFDEAKLAAYNAQLRGLTVTQQKMALMTTIAEEVSWLLTYNKRLEESRQEMIEAGKEAAQLTKDLDGLIEQYRKLGEGGEFDNSDREVRELSNTINRNTLAKRKHLCYTKTTERGEGNGNQSGCDQHHCRKG